jgi:hypothetical protein
MPEFSSERIVMTHIFNGKLSRVGFTAAQVAEAQERFTKKVFGNYDQKLETVDYHNYICTLEMTNFSLRLDSREVVGKPAILAQFAPRTAHSHPDVDWEMLDGFKVNFTIGRIFVSGIDLDCPFYDVSEFILKGTVLIAEVKNPGYVTNRPTVCSVPLKLQVQLAT